MSEQREGKEIMRFYMPEGLKNKYKRLCGIKGTTMTEDLIAYMESEVEENKEFIEMAEKKFGGK